MNLPAKTLLHKLYYGIDKMPSWNPTVIEAKILKVSTSTVESALLQMMQVFS